MPFRSEAQRRWMHWAEGKGLVPKGTAAEWESKTRSKLPKKVGQKKMKKADTVVNNLIARPLDLEQHIQSQLDPSALKYIILLRYQTKDMDLHDPREFAVQDHYVRLHKVEPGIYDGVLLSPAKDILMEFHGQSLPIIGSMLAVKLGDIEQPVLTPEIPQLSPVEVVPAPMSMPQEPSPAVAENVVPQTTIHIPQAAHDVTITILSKAQEAPKKKSRLQRMWKIFNIGMPDDLTSKDSVSKAHDGSVKLGQRLQKQGKSASEAAYIVSKAMSERYSSALVKQAFEHYALSQSASELEKAITHYLQGERSKLLTPRTEARKEHRALTPDKEWEWKGKNMSKKFSKSTLKDAFTPDESMQPKNPEEMLELREADAEARFNQPKYKEAEWKGSVRKSSSVNTDVEKLMKSESKTFQYDTSKFKQHNADELKKANAKELTDSEQMQKAQIDFNWNRHPQKNYFEKDDRSESEKYLEKSCGKKHAPMKKNEEKKEEKKEESKESSSASDKLYETLSKLLPTDVDFDDTEKSSKLMAQLKKKGYSEEKIKKVMSYMKSKKK